MKSSILSKLLFVFLLTFVVGCETYQPPGADSGDAGLDPNMSEPVVVQPDMEQAVVDIEILGNPQLTLDTVASIEPSYEVSGSERVTESAEMAEPNYAVVTAFFGTDRSYIKDANPAQRFGTERSKLRYGQVEVSIPREHRMGELEAPGWLAKRIVGENPEKHVVLLNAEPLGKDKTLQRIREAAADTENAAFVFVHGYKTSFEKAARRTAQMAYDIGFKGAPIFYSWPSQDSTIKYTVDEQNAEWTKNHLKIFLKEVAENLDGRKIFLIAHSMGNRPVTRALIDLKNEVPAIRDETPFEEIILAAPDIDAAVFRDDIAPRLGDASSPVTLYVSQNDKALLASHKVHDFPRIGDARAGIEPIEGFEVIDASAVETDFLSHSYFADASSVLSDIFYLIRDGKRANERFGLVSVGSTSSGLWRIKQR